MPGSNIEDIFKNDGKAKANVILENYIRNGISTPMAMLPDEESDLIADSKKRNDHKLKLEEEEKDILQAVRGKGYLSLNGEKLINLCRKSEMYVNLLYAIQGDYILRGYYDIDRIKKIFWKTYSYAFENLREKKGLNKDEEEDMGITIALIGYVAIWDFVGSFKNSDLMLKDFSLYEFASLRFGPGATSWTDWFYFWGRSIWDVASWAAIIGGAVSGLFVVGNPVVGGALVLVGAVTKYVSDYVLRSRSEIRDSYKRYGKFDGDLKQLKEFYDKAVNNKFKIEALKDLELVKKGYDKKRFYKLFSENFKIGAIVLGVISGVSLSLLIPGLAPIFLAKALSVASLVSVGTVSGFLSIGSVVGTFLFRRAYDTLENQKKSIITNRIKDKENKISLADFVKKNLEQAKEDKIKAKQKTDPTYKQQEKE